MKGLTHSRWQDALFLLLLCFVEFQSVQLLCELLVRNSAYFYFATHACILSIVPFALIAVAYFRNPRSTFIGLILFGWIVFASQLSTSTRWIRLLGLPEVVYLTGCFAVLSATTVLALSPGFRQRLQQSAQVVVAPLRKAFTRLAFVAAAIATLVGLFYTFENWRGNRAWNAWKAKRQAEGKWIDSLSAIAPPPVPDDQNFAMTPLLRGHLDYDDNVKGVERYRDPDTFARVNKIRTARTLGDRRLLLPLYGSWSKAEPADLAALQVYYRRGTNFPTGTDPTFIDKYLRNLHRAYDDSIDFPIPEKPGSPGEDILAALSLHDRELNEISTDIRLPHSRFPIHYHATPGEILLPHLASLKGLSSVYRLRAVAQIATNDRTGSFHDLMTGYRLSTAVTNEPFVISLLVRNAILEVMHNSLWEGLRIRSWTPAQLQAFQQFLQAQNLIAHYAIAMVAEGNAIASVFERSIRENRELWRLYFRTDDEQFRRDLYLDWAPSGWFRLNALESMRLIESIEDALEQNLSLRDYPASTTPLDDWQKTPSYRNFFARAITGFSHKAWTRTMRVQTHLNLAITACALERYFLNHQDYPDSLEELVPAYLETIPIDHADNQPLRYRRTDDGRYRVYSVGSNFEDDGGRFAENFASNKGDWVWCYQAEFLDPDN